MLDGPFQEGALQSPSVFSPLFMRANTASNSNGNFSIFFLNFSDITLPRKIRATIPSNSFSIISVAFQKQLFLNVQTQIVNKPKMLIKKEERYRVQGGKYNYADHKKDSK